MKTETFPCLSVRQPWADLIVSGIKDVENRSWSTDFRGLILIHASRSIDAEAVSHLLPLLRLQAVHQYHPSVGAIVGFTEIVDCVTHHPSPFFSGPFGFVLANSRRFSEPIPLAGRLGIFPVPTALLFRYLPSLPGPPGILRRR